MANNLPKVFQNKNIPPLNNVLKQTKVDNRCYETEQSENIYKKINDIFNSNSFVYKKVARITTINNVFTATIVGKSGNYLVTLEQGNINISDIKNIVI